MSAISFAGFTNVGYRLHSRNFRPIDADLNGQTVVVTGASGGLGLETARRLADLGAKVIMVARDPEKLERAAGTVSGVVVAEVADLSLMSEVAALAVRILEEQGSIDVLINNVGVLLPERTETAEGLETALATNLAGHMSLTHRLLPRLVKSAPARIINVSSGGAYAERIHPEDLGFEAAEYRGAAAYARTKRGQLILTEMWAKRLDRTGVVVHAMHPGWAKTSGVANSLPTFNRIMKPLLRTAEQGADTIVWLAAAEEPAASSGHFWFDREVTPTHLSEATRETEGEREAFWNALESLTGTPFPSLQPSKR